MDDLISRQPILDSYKRICESCGEDKKYGGAICGTCYLDDAISIVEDAPSAQQWIPCSEEEPSFGIEVLVTRKGTVRLAERSIFDKEYPWYIHGHHSYNAKTVDAWMSLPEPYEGEEE